MTIRVASYNIHKAVGVDGRRDPERILTVLKEIDADVIALQEADRRFGRRETCLPLDMIDDHGLYRAVPLDTRPDSIGWHGNALLVRRGVEVIDASVVPLPVIEPRGAVCADVMIHGMRLRVVGMHLDISGIRRRGQVRAVISHVAHCGPPCATVLMGDLNQWSAARGAMREFGHAWHLLSPGRSFPSRRPVAGLDRIIICDRLRAADTGVHHSALAARASDHLPVWADLAPATA